jgi:hypothetical protein
MGTKTGAFDDEEVQEKKRRKREGTKIKKIPTQQRKHASNA